MTAGAALESGASTSGHLNLQTPGRQQATSAWRNPASYPGVKPNEIEAGYHSINQFFVVPRRSRVHRVPHASL